MTDETLTSSDRGKITRGIRGKYTRVARTPKGSFNYPTGVAGMTGLNYPDEAMKNLPDTVKSSFCGVGNPFSLGRVRPNEYVLDIGCGGGVDTLCSGILTGPGGKSVGVDSTPEMLDRAKINLEAASVTNTSFVQASAEDLPFEDSSFDVVISNGVLNLVIDKKSAFSEIIRVLKPCGRMMLADQVRKRDVQANREAMVNNWFR